jgi:hypothetical protein
MLWERLSLSVGSVEGEIQSSRLSDNGPGRLRVKEKILKYERIKFPEPEFPRQNKLQLKSILFRVDEQTIQNDPAATDQQIVEMDSASH